MKCPEPGCPGEIEEGYCNVTGMSLASITGQTGGTSGSSAASASSSPSSPSAPTATVTRQRTNTTKTTSPRHRLGAGLVEIDPIPRPDPAAAVLTDPSVSESKRFCANDGEPVGRGQDGRPGRTEGFCRKCGQPFSFTPRLVAGDLVGGQYEVVGCIAHGGLGWIYLARDRRVDDKWVVLKGVLNSGDSDALRLAIAELRFLAAVDHPNIVKVINFAEHGGDGYIVMEYVGGTSLRQLLEARRAENGGNPDPLPPDLAIAYILDILPAFGYLHRNGLLFCDFKPDNVIQTEGTLKLIDLGAVYRMDDMESPIYGTPGFQAPEIADTGPTVPSDLFTVGRTLAVLCTSFRGYQSTYEFTLPPADDVPLYGTYDSLHQLLLRATALHPDDRFQTAEEMADQLYGVLREVVASQTGSVDPAPSTLFTSELRGALDAPDWTTLPALLVASDDPGAGFLAAIAGVTDPDELASLLAQAPQRTVEVKLREARAAIDAERFSDADSLLAEVEAEDPWDWRVGWYRGLGFLHAGQPTAALEEFRSVYRTIPGELAPKLALGFAAECAGQYGEAAGWYDIVSRTDPNFTTAAFGLARCSLADSDRAGAIEAFNRVPDASIASVDAQVAKAETLLDSGTDSPALADLVAAGAVVAQLPARGEARARLTAEVFRVALDVVQANGHAQTPTTVLGRSLTEPDIRLGLEDAYRTLARQAPNGVERIALVDQANAVRPRTLT